jgi:hypothetical protein
VVHSSGDGGRKPVVEYQAQRLVMEGKNLSDYISFELVRGLPGKPFSVLSQEGLDLVSYLMGEHPGDALKELCIRVRESTMLQSVCRIWRGF